MFLPDVTPIGRVAEFAFDLFRRAVHGLRDVLCRELADNLRDPLSGEVGIDEDRAWFQLRRNPVSPRAQ